MTIENFQEDFDNAVRVLQEEARLAAIRIERERLFGQILTAAAELSACYEPHDKPAAPEARVS